MKLRIVTAAVAATLAVAGLAGCRTNVGTAASVDGHRITESKVNSYLTANGADPSLAASAKQQGQTISPRSQVLQFLIQEQLFRKTLEKTGGVPSDAQLAALHDEAASLLLQTQLGGDDLDKALAQGLPRSGVSSKFADTYLRVNELEYAIIKRKQLAQLSELTGLIKKLGIPVSVSPRYGTWSPTNLALDSKATTPSFLTVQPTPGAPAAGAAAQPAG